MEEPHDFPPLPGQTRRQPHALASDLYYCASGLPVSAYPTRETCDPSLLIHFRSVPDVAPKRVNIPNTPDSAMFFFFF